MNINFPLSGEILSLCSAIFWALAVVLFKLIGDKIHPIALNLFKNALGVLLFIITLFLLDQSVLPPKDMVLTTEDYFRLILSGIIGMGIADIIFLHSLNIIGAGISALVDTVYSPFVILFAFLILGEQLSPLQFLGGGCIISAIIFASMKLKNIPTTRKRLKYGILLGILAIAMMAFGIVLVKPVLNKFQGNVLILIWIAGFRLIPGSLVPLICFLFLNKKHKFLSSFKEKKIWWPLISGSISATYLGIFFWIIGMSLTKASTASILNQTATIFILIFARLILKEQLTKWKVLAIIIAMVGAYLVFIG